MTTVTIYQPAYFPGGATFAVEIRNVSGNILVPFWSEQEAWDFKDQCHMEGFTRVRVLGAPCLGFAVVPKPEGELDIIDDEPISLAPKS